MNLATSFEKLKNEMFIRYRGCLIEREGYGFKVFGETYSCIEQAKQAVDKRYILFNNILKTQNS